MTGEFKRKEQEKAEREKAEREKTEQKKAEQEKAGQERTEQEAPAQENARQERACGSLDGEILRKAEAMARSLPSRRCRKASRSSWTFLSSAC